jgi:hypothetical protein
MQPADDKRTLSEVTGFHDSIIALDPTLSFGLYGPDKTFSSALTSGLSGVSAFPVRLARATAALAAVACLARYGERFAEEGRQAKVGPLYSAVICALACWAVSL